MSAPITILLINGPNLNLLGTREPARYGTTTLSDVVSDATTQATSLGVCLQSFQSNHEGAIVDRIHDLRQILSEGGSVGVVINAGALTHTSIAVRDALLGVGVEFVEVHVTNVHAREEWRHRSFLADKAVAVVCGMGVYGYTAAVEFMARRLKAAQGAKL